MKFFSDWTARLCRIASLRARVASAAVFLVFCAAPSYAAVTANSVVTAQTPKAYKAQIVNASGTSAVTLAAAGTNGTKIWSVIASNTDSGAAYAITLQVSRSSTAYVLCTVNVPLSSGNTTAAAPINMLAPVNCPGLPVDSDGNPYLFLESTDTLQVLSGTTVTAAKAVSVQTVGADF